MTFKFSLRYRVALTFLTLGWLVSIIMGVTLYLLTISMEKDLITETLSSELDNYISRYSMNPSTPSPSSTYIKGYAINQENVDILPPPLQELSLGLSHIILDGTGSYVLFKEVDGTRFYVVYADQQIKHRENQYFVFIAFAIGLMTLLSSIVGFWLAGRVISPVTELARWVSQMGPSSRPLSNNSSNHYHDEVGELALAFNLYHRRLAEFNQRERDFTSDVSHELRTPLAVIEGALEVLLSQTKIDTDNRKRVLRVARAANQIKHLTTALLSLAREECDDGAKYECPVGSILNKVVEEHKYLLNHKQVQFKVEIGSDSIIQGDPILLYVVLANIIQNAFSYTHQGIVNIHLDGKHILVEDTGTGMREDQRIKMFDRYYSDNRKNGGQGIGLSLVRRICERYDWKISVSSHKELGTSINLILD